MKKVALSLIALLAAGSFAFGDAAADIVKSPVTFSLDVNAQAQWGIDLDTKVHGFANSETGAITLWLLNGTSTKTGEGDTHGYISIADVKIGFDDTAPAGTFGTASVGDITAKIVAGDLYVKLNEVTDPSIGYAFDADDDNGGNTADDTYKMYSGAYGATATEWNYANIAGNTSWTGTGVEIGYTVPSVVGLTAGIASSGSWSAAKANNYEGALEASLLAVEKLTLKAKAHAEGLKGDINSDFGATLAYDLGMVTPFADVNYALVDSSYTADFGAKLPLADGLKIVAFGTYDSDAVIGAFAVLELAEAKLAGPLSANVGARFIDINKVVQTNTFGEVFAKVGFKATDVVKLYGSVDAYSAYNVDTKSIFAKAGVDYTGISLTTLSVNWDSSDLGDAKAQGDNKLGSLVFTAKVAY